MTIRQLEHFMALARTLSFTEASRQSFVSQPALSRSLASLEEELGVQLLQRDRHRVSLTQAGMILAAALPKLKRELDSTVEAAQQTREGVRGTLTLGVLVGMALPPELDSTLRFFRQSLPFIELDFRCMGEDELIRALMAGQLDAVCSVDTDTGAGQILEKLVLREGRACLAVPAEREWPSPCSLSRLDGETLVFACAETSHHVHHWRALLIQAGATVQLRFVSGVSTQLMPVARGYGAAILPAEHTAFAGAGLRRVELEPPVPVYDCLLWDSRNLNPSLGLLIRTLSEEYAN